MYDRPDLNESARDLLQAATARLKQSDTLEHWPADRERREASLLLTFALGDAEPSEELDNPQRHVSPRIRARFLRFVERRATGEPVATILGWTTFRGLRVGVKRGAFLPRQSSELLADLAVQRLRRRQKPVAVDLATGVGPVALAVAQSVPRASVHGTDISVPAVAQARANASSLGLQNASFYRGDLFGSLPRDLRGRVDVITVHPPYVPVREVEDLPVEVKGFEPKSTLTDGSVDGMGLLERTASEAPDWLRRGGWLLVEVSPDRAREVRSRLVRSGYQDVRSMRGWPDMTRVIGGRA